jgi:hypothetical protein
MKKHLHSILLSSLLIVSSLVIYSCKKTAEGETTSWNSNAQQVVTLKQQYPQFANAIDQQFVGIKKQWDDAQTVSGDEAKISAMSAANAAYYASFIYTLGNMESQKSKIRDLQDKLRRLNGNSEVSYRVSSSQSECSNTLSMIEMTMTRGAQTPNEAISILQILKMSVDNTITHCNDVIAFANELERKKNDAQKQANNNNTNTNNNSTNTNTNTNTTPSAGTAVKCAYCGTSNPSGGGTCSSCKAPL